jgi:hypothetical protein
VTLRLRQLRTYDRNGEVEQVNFGAGMTLLVGPRNSSKTTTLRMVDYCMGSDDSAAAALGPEVAARYLGIEVDVQFGDQVHVIRRAFDSEFGLLTRLYIDGDPMLPRDFSDWALAQLGWPVLDIPKGRVAQAATELVPLSFRTLWRHIYRREDSWLVFANQEQEFHRRAVLSLFLGLAESRYSNAEYHAAAAMRRVDELRQQLADVQVLGDQTVRQVASELGLPETSARLVTDRDSELAAEIERAEAARHRIAASARATSGFATEQAARFQNNSGQISDLRGHVHTLQATLANYMTVLALGEAESRRLSRARTAVESLSAMPVTICPVCGQGTPHPPESSIESGQCYLCAQPVVTDARARRIELERAIIGREASELQEAIDRTTVELATESAELSRLVAQQEVLARRLDEERMTLLAPYVSELEDLSRQIGGLEQKRAALSGLKGLLGRQEAIEEQVLAALKDADEAESAVQAAEVTKTETHRRCSTFAKRMTEFLNGIESEPWRFGEVALAGEELSFYVGGGPWEVVLGGESKVLFLMSYHYALMHLATDLPGISCAPGLAVLDNPHQQGLSAAVVAECLDMLAAAAEEQGGQVIATLARPVPMTRRASVHPLTVQYSPTS